MSEAMIMAEQLDDITRRAREVAKKTGILLGIARIPDAEAAVLKEVEQAFDD